MPSLKNILAKITFRKVKTEVEKKTEELPLEERIKIALQDLAEKQPGLFYDIYNYFFSIRYDRLQRYFEYDRMDLLSPEISAALDIYKSEILQNVKDDYFIITSKYADKAERVQNLIRNWIRFFEDNHSITFPDLIRKLLKYGDLFLDPVFVYEKNVPVGIVGFRALPEFCVYRVFVKERDKILEKWVYLPWVLKETAHITSPQALNIPGQMISELQSAFISAARNSSIFPDAIRQNYASPFFFAITEKRILEREIFESIEDLKEYIKEKKGLILDHLIHIAIQPNIFHPFGTSVVEPLRLKWRQLYLLQTALMLYRIFYGVDRKLWKIKLPSKIPPVEREKIIRDIIQRIRKTPTFSPATGYDETSRILGLIEDLFIPETENFSITVDSLDRGGKEISQIEDVLLITREIELGLKIPRLRLLGGHGERVSATALTMEDARFASYIQQLQKYITKGIKKLLVKHYEILMEKEKNSANILEIRKFLEDVNIEMPMISSNQEKLRLDTFSQKIKYINDLINLIGAENISEEAKLRLIKETLGIDFTKYLKETKK